MIEDTWLPVALRVGITYKDFWELTPHDMNLIVKSYREKMKEKLDYDNLICFLQGRYIVDSLLCTVGNMFSKKGAKNHEYPKEPYDLNPEEERELTEEEKEIQVKAIFMNLERMKENFERAKKGESM